MNFYKSKQWKRKRAIILRRDGYECKECKRYGKNRTATTIHHCNPLNVRPELRLENWNLIALCNECHERMHVRSGDELTERGNFWREKVTPPPAAKKIKVAGTERGSFFPPQTKIQEKGVREGEIGRKEVRD